MVVDDATHLAANMIKVHLVMKKILAAFDGLKYSPSTASHAIDIAHRTNSKLIGVFLEDFTYHSYKMVDLIGTEHVEEERAIILNKKDAEARENSVEEFRNACRNAKVDFAVHRDKNIAIQELLRESLYSDLLIIQNDETLTHYAENVPTNFIVSLLERTECPVLLVPKMYTSIDKVVFLYDGTPNSMYAIKEFTNVFGEAGLAADVVFVKKENDDALPDGRLTREWFRLHYDNPEFHSLKGNPAECIPNHLRRYEGNTVVVLGAYARGTISRLIHKSLADVLMEKLRLPVLVAHK